MKPKPVLAIISDTIRADLHQPLKYFRRFSIVHFYRQTAYQDMTKKDFAAAPAVRFGSPFELIKLLNSLKPNIVQLPEPTAGRRAAFTTLVLLPVAKRIGARVITPFFENVPLEQKFTGPTRSFVRAVTRRLIRQADLLIYLNRGARRNLIALGAPAQKLVKLFWGSWGAGEYFRPSEKLKVKSEKLKIVLYVGVVSRRKGIGYLVEAMQAVRQRVPRAELWLAGPAGDFTPPKEPWLKVLGPIKNEKLPEIFKKATLLTLPSISTITWQEQVGMVNLQALASGLPVVTTNSGAIAQFVRQGHGVVVVRQQDSRALAQAILKILTMSSTQYTRFVSRGVAFARKHYDLRRNIATIEKILVERLCS